MSFNVRIRFGKSALRRKKKPSKAKRRDSFWAVTPFLSVVTVLTPATTWTEGFTNRLIVTDYSEKFPRWQLREFEKRRHVLFSFIIKATRARSASVPIKKTGQDEPDRSASGSCDPFNFRFRHHLHHPRQQ